MSEIKIKLPDNSIRNVPIGTTAQDIAEQIGPGLARAVLVAKIDGVLKDLNTPIIEDCSIELLTGDNPEGHNTLLHSAAHLMAQAVKHFWPNAKLTIGPAIENRFYYDFDLDTAFTDEDLIKIDKKMHELSNNNFPCIRCEVTRKEAYELFKKMDEDYKLEILEDIEDDELLTSYSQGDFIDLCRGPHVPSTGKIKHFKLLSTSGAYWRGNENNKMLQRIYGTVFAKKDDLKKYLSMLEEAKKRDHRKIGKEMNLYTFDNEIGPGLPLWLPNGTVIIEELEKLAKYKERKAGYDQVRTPHLTKGTVYERSGHLDHYKESMYPKMNVDGVDYYVKPMNCPHHHKIFSSIPRSYRDMPVRLSEYGTCYRYEKSGQLFGLMRVRSLQMNDAHIYCSPDQFKEEFINVCKMYLDYFELFDIKKYKMRLSLHDKEHLGDKYVNEPELWIETEQWVREALDEGSFNYVEVPGEAAFYGPKIDVQVWSAIGKEFTLATNQVDFVVPKRFNLSYKDENGTQQTPICIHRAPLSTHERFIGFLIEHFGGNFPLWLAPVQVAILPVSDKTNNYAKKIAEKLNEAEIRVLLDDRSDKIGAKIRNAEINRINVMLIIGPKEEENNTVSVRRKFSGDLGTFDQGMLISGLLDEIKDRSLTHR
ncbi:MAG: threonine--tRNA ligase [Candidatus Neomarinimicrobiota bacterium]|nr:threonine--tRNA ligase [Candidatus Neomarinimicrobiota bacterium]